MLKTEWLRHVFTEGVQFILTQALMPHKADAQIAVWRWVCNLLRVLTKLLAMKTE